VVAIKNGNVLAMRVFQGVVDVARFGMGVVRAGNVFNTSLFCKFFKGRAVPVIEDVNRYFSSGQSKPLAA